MLGRYPDWWTNKDYAVLKAVEVFGTVRGRKALHKVLYFADLKTHMFKYQWYKYGPYSPDLAPKITNLMLKSLKVEEHNSGSITRYDMSLAADGRALLEHGKHEEIDSAVEWAHRLLADMPPREMELMASVHYLDSCVEEQGEVYGLMQRLKPDANFTEKDVERALQFLVGEGLIEPARVVA